MNVDSEDVSDSGMEEAFYRPTREEAPHRR
jgi:hypothetical protein